MSGTTDPILVTGASGHLGTRVIHHLLTATNLHPHKVIATTRTPSRLEDLAARGVSVRYADFDEPETLRHAFDGARTVLIISTDELDLVNGRRVRQHEAAVTAAERAGAAHVAYTSMLRPEPGSPFVLAGDHFATEQAIRASGMSFTIFRNNAYFENLLVSLPAIIGSGRWPTSAGGGRVAYAGRDDIAAAIAGHLASSPADSATLNLTGPTAYSHAEIVRLVKALIGATIELLPMSDDALVEFMVGTGVPRPYARLAASADANVRAGNSEEESDVLERLSHRRPQRLEQFMEANEAVLRA